MKLNILILSLSNINSDPRVLRQINWLSEEYQITIAGYVESRRKNIIDISPIKLKLKKINLLKVCYQYFRILVGKNFPFIKKIYYYFKRIKKKYLSDNLVNENLIVNLELDKFKSDDYKNELYYRDKLNSLGTYKKLKTINPDLIIANDLDALVLSKLFWPNTKVILDAHEYSPLEYNSNDINWLSNEKPARIWACNKYLPQISAMTTVCQGIADEYKKNFNILENIRIITNAPHYESIPIKKTNDIIKLVHHGIGSPLRKIEVMAEVAKLLGFGWELHLILVEGDLNYIKYVKNKYSNSSNIFFHDPVPTIQISKFISQFDIGIFIIEPEIFNYKWCLPNKFFEFIQARLALAIGPSPEMANIVSKYNLGVVSKDFQINSMVESFKSLTKEMIDNHKSNSDKVADIFCAERNKDIMLDLINKLYI